MRVRSTALKRVEPTTRYCWCRCILTVGVRSAVAVSENSAYGKKQSAPRSRLRGAPGLLSSVAHRLRPAFCEIGGHVGASAICLRCDRTKLGRLCLDVCTQARRFEFPFSASDRSHKHLSRLDQSGTVEAWFTSESFVGRWRHCDCRFFWQTTFPAVVAHSCSMQFCCVSS